MKKRQFLNPAPIFEELEPRLLFSADGAEALAAPVVEQAYEEPVVIAAPESPVEATAVDQPTEQKTTAAADSPAVGEVAPAVADTAPSETSAPLTERQAQEKDVAESTGSETTEEEATGENITKQQTSTNQTDGTAVNTDLKQESVEQTGIVTESAIGEKRRETVLPDTETSKELVLVNDNVQNYEELVDDIGRTDSGERSIEVVVLDDKQDGITQVNEILHEHNDLDAVHFITHSSDGFLQLGSTWYTTDSLDKQTDDLSGWSKALDEGGDLLFYGCNLAQGENGKLFVDTLAELTDLDVAASDDMTGSAEHVGDWDLEYTVGTVDATSPFTSVRPENWDHALVTYTVTNTNDSGTGSLRQAINDANNNSGSDTITFNIDTSDSGYVFYEDDGTVNSLTGTVTHTPTQADTDFSDGWYRI
ncbi:MAG TPA: DUF4347 domain-containing protein, partial [Desulfobulbus sp.]|nr:DUF4347 domain-containing protein [Desulfobulbus sp.]